MSKKKSQASNPGSRREALRAQQLQELKRQRTNKIILITTIIVAVLVIAIVTTVLVQNHLAKRNDEQFTAEGQITPSQINDAGDAIRYNTEQNDGPTATLFLDYQCPGCAQADKTWVPVLQTLADRGDINLDFHVLYGLDRSFPGNHSRRAAIATTCVVDSGHFSDYTEEIYANQPAQEGDGWTDDELKQWAQDAGITGEDYTAFETCFDGLMTSDFVQKMQDTLPSYLTATPSLTVNDQVVDLSQISSLEPDEWLTVIESYA